MFDSNMSILNKSIIIYMLYILINCSRFSLFAGVSTQKLFSIVMLTLLVSSADNLRNSLDPDQV